MSMPHRFGAGRLFKPGRASASRALPFKVFIGYADLPSVRCATGTIAEAVRASRREIDIQPMLWRFEQLASTHWSGRAVAAARDADVIVLASSTAGPLAPAIEEWVNTFLHANRGRRATIIAVSGGSEAWTISLEEPAPVLTPVGGGTVLAATI